MRVRVRSSKDVYSGILFVVFGAGFAYVSRSYSMGTAQHMGPAFFPFFLGTVMTVLGILVAIRGLIIHNAAPLRLAFRPLLFVIAGAAIFALMIGTVGLVAALAGLVFVSALGGHEYRFWEVTILWIALTILTAAVFIYGLGLPLKVWPL